MSVAAVPKGRYELYADDDDVIGLTILRSYPSGWSVVRVDPPFMDAYDEYGVMQFVVERLNRAASIGTCAERESRAAMTDAEFWQHVFGQREDPRVTLPGWGEGDEALDCDITTTSDPCAECGAVGACGWDAEGRPLIHAEAIR